MAIRWSRMELYLSVLTCKGLFETIRERIQYAPERSSMTADEDRTRPGHEETLALPRYCDYAGAVHVHSTYSDGAGSVAEIADAANQAGLDFVVLCDHSSLEARRDGQDGWRGRTLIVVGTEVTTDAGHLLALDVPDSFLPASNDPKIAQEEIVKHGGVGFIALPCDLKDHWDDFALRDKRIGLEVFNLSAIARSKINLPTLALIWSRYRGSKPHKAFHWVAARPSKELRLWDSLIGGNFAGKDAHATSTMGGTDLTPYNVVVGIGSVDAHGIMKFAGRSYRLPTYGDVFRTLRTHVLLEEPVSYGEGDSSEAVAQDLAAFHAALAAGHCYMAYDNYADSTGFVFECTTDRGRSLMGDSLPAPNAAKTSEYRIIARAPKTRSFIRLYRDGKPIAASRGGFLEYVTRQPGAYRVEVFLFRFRIGNLCLNAKPWIFSNPIYIQPIALSTDRAVDPALSPGHTV